VHGYNRPGFLPPQPSCGTDASYPINVIPERRWRSSELSGTHCALGAAFRQNLAPLLGCLNLRELSIPHAPAKSARNAIRLRRIQAFAVPIGTPSWSAISR
jgi:hypothetical protein